MKKKSLEPDRADAIAHLGTHLKKYLFQTSHKDTMLVDAGHREQATGLEEGRDAGVLAPVREQLRPSVAEDPGDQDAFLTHGHGALPPHLPIRLAHVLRVTGFGRSTAMAMAIAMAMVRMLFVVADAAPEEPILEARILLVVADATPEEPILGGCLADGRIFPSIFSQLFILLEPSLLGCFKSHFV